MVGKRTGRQNMAGRGAGDRRGERTSAAQLSALPASKMTYAATKQHCITIASQQACIV